MDQRFGQVTNGMKCYMPDAAPAGDLWNSLPGCIWYRDIKNSKPAHLFGMAARIRVCDRSSPIVSNQQNFIETQLVDELVNVGGDRPFIVACGRTRRIAEAAHIGRD